MEGSKKLVDGIEERFGAEIASQRLTVKRAFVTAENIDQLIRDHIRGDIDLLSIDLDGNDFYVLNAIECVNPRVIVAEYNGNLGPNVDWVMKYNPKHIYDGSSYFGASLKAFEKLLKLKGYLLVGSSINGVNAFFVRDDLEYADSFLAPFSSEEHYETLNLYLSAGVNMGARKQHGPWNTSSTALQD